MHIRERWIRYCLKIECKICSEAVFPDREDAELAVDFAIDHTDAKTNPNTSIDELKDALTWWYDSGVPYCDYHVHMLNKDC